MQNHTGTPSLEWLLFSFEGRVSRGTFINYILSTVVVAMAASAALAQVEILLPALRLFLIPSAFFLVVLCFFVVSCLQAKRLHDLGYSGWLVLLNLVPVLDLVLLLLCCGLRGSSGENRFGVDPTVAGDNPFDLPA